MLTVIVSLLRLSRLLLERRAVVLLPVEAVSEVLVLVVAVTGREGLQQTGKN